MGKYDVLRQLAEAGLPVPPTCAIRPGEQVDPTDVRRRLGQPEGVLYAVRSSCEAEDGSDRSYAGQFETRLDVPEEGLEEAVESVFASYRRVAAYEEAGSGETAKRGKTGGRRHAGKDADDVGGVVVIQPMAPAELSGVAFTSDPEGFVGECVIVIGEGLGEGVVSDSVDTTTWHVPEGGGMWHFGAESVASRVSPETVLTVCSLARRCAEVVSGEADMEFAIAPSGSVTVLQARPITVIAGIPAADAVSGAALLDNSNIVESYPGTCLPLTQGFACDMYERVFRSVAMRLSGDEVVVESLDGPLSSLVEFSDWHAYYRISSWYALLSLLPMSGRIKRAWRESLGVPDGEGDLGASAKVPARVKARVARRLAACIADMDSLMEDACDRAEAAIAEAGDEIARARTFRRLWSAYEEMRDSVMSVWDVTLINDVNTFLFTSLADEATRVADEGRRQVESMRPKLAMDALVALAEREGQDSDTYAEARDAFVSEFGDRCVGELKLETRTWRESPESLDAYVASAAGSARSGDRDGRVVSVRGASRKARSVRGLAFSGRASSGAAHRERSRLLRTRMFGVARTMFLSMGDMLVEAGLLASRRDVFYLTLEELEAAGASVGGHAGDASTSDGDNGTRRLAGVLRRKVADRKAKGRRLSRIPTPPRLRVAGEGPHDHGLPDILSVDARSGAGHVPEGMTLRGTGTSRGVAEGEVVVTDGTDMTLDTSGKVLVARSTDPGWVFLISHAAAIVAERGSLLSHTAIISRELGIPAVVGVHDATRVLRDGDVVSVDGGDGTVSIVSRRGKDEEPDAAEGEEAVEDGDEDVAGGQA